MTLPYTIAIVIGITLVWTFYIFVVRAFYIFLRFRKSATLQRREINYYLSEGLKLDEAIARVLSDLNRQRGLALTEATISTVSRKLADFSSMMHDSNIVDILAQFTQRYILLETRMRFFGGTPIVIDNSKVLYAVEHLDLEERSGYFLIPPSTEADFASKYSDAH